MQVLQRLTGAATAGAGDPAELLQWARAQPVRRVVVKRPRRAPDLGGLAPGHRLSGRAVRFDVYPQTGARRDRRDAAVADGE